MKIKKYVALILCVMMVVGLLAAPAAAAVTATAPIVKVRVNGKLVEFPDEQPYGDENQRTMIPVRFVTEEMGADVSWDGPNQTAVIKKNGITVRIKIGDNILKVTKNGATNEVAMDTVAVGKNGRTFVPIRFVAEALGAYVEWAGAYQTVGIYCDGALTAEEIKLLRSYDMSAVEGANSYATSQKISDPENVAEDFGPADKRAAMVGDFSVAHEFLYSSVETPTWERFENDIWTEVKGDTEYYDLVVADAINEINYVSDRVKVTFRADTSGVYQPDARRNLFVTVRGILTVEVFVPLTQLPANETHIFTVLGINQVGTPGNPVTYVYDAHMKTNSNVRIYANNVLDIVSQ